MNKYNNQFTQKKRNIKVFMQRGEESEINVKTLNNGK